MQLRSFIAVALAAAIAAPAPATAQSLTPSEASALTGSFIVLLPFSLVALSGAVVSNKIEESLDGQKQWRVAAIKPQGDKTAVELRSADARLKLDMMVDTKVALARQLKVDDTIGIEAVGKTGYVVSKGAATIGLLAEPGSGMVHSKART